MLKYEMKINRMKFPKVKLHNQILIGLVLGLVCGLLFGENIVWVKPVGTAFIRLITMVVVPLVFASLLVGTASLGDIKKLGRIGGKTLLFFAVTTVIAAIIGLVLVNIVEPGSNIPPETRTLLMESFKYQAEMKVENVQQAPSILQIFLNIIPSNPFASFSETNILQIIFFAIFFGITLTLIPNEKADVILKFFEGLNDVMIKMVLIIMKAAPIGVFALIASIIGEFGQGIIMSLFSFLLVVIAGCLIHLFTVYPLSLRYLSKYSIRKFFKGIRPAQYIAFSSTSSSATLPINMQVCEKDLNIPPQICSFVLPLGATINMNGSSLYQAVSAVFITTVLGIDLSVTQQIYIVFIATLSAVGTAGVPAASIVMLAMVLSAMNIPLDMIALVLGVDRIVDMFRTTVNITGDACCAVYIASSEGELRKEGNRE